MYNPDAFGVLSMRELRITPVDNENDRLAFLQFPWKVYRGDRYWVPPLLSERKAFTDPAKNPFYQHARVQLFLARRGDEIVGTIAAFTNDLYNQFHESNVGWFGFFEVLEDPQAAQALLDAAAAWVRQAGHKAILGPAQFSTNDEIGLLVDGFDDTPRILMTYNPRRYPGYVEAAGFHKAMDLLAYTTSIDEMYAKGGPPPKLLRVVEMMKKRRHVTVRSVDMKHFDRAGGTSQDHLQPPWARNQLRSDDLISRSTAWVNARSSSIRTRWRWPRSMDRWSASGSRCRI
jgi:hypothetical protein